MKKTLFLLTFVMLSTAILQAQVKIGVIDAQKVFEKSNQGKQIQTELENKQTQKQKEFEVLENNIKQLERDVMSPALNEATREKKSLELQNKRIELKRKVEDAQSEIQKESLKQLTELEKSIMPIINNYGKANGFTVIYDISRSSIIYFDNTIDITDEIVRIFNSQ
ncbi:MAG TPA: OmpH family outer membrane protein [Chitinophagaceae bacterium]|nr:OmpH family outer membrane protein [Chitinophagaceae bacterium]MCB9056521.1 OmpH family outer membrane protein [Chitinophagales bacterium]HPG12297.1 OmpH family outer membrane protein [Chitinophagaceae bacterium]